MPNALPAANPAAHVLDSNDVLSCLLYRTGSGDAEAFDQLYRIAAGPLGSYARKLVHGWGCGDEVMQEAFLLIWLSARHYDAARAAPMSWLRTIVRNKAFDLFRRQAARIPGASGDWDDSTLAAAAPWPCERVQAAQEIALLACWMQLLGAEQRCAIELTWLHELSHVDAAASMGKPLGTVKTLVRRGLIRLRAASGATGGAGPARQSAYKRPPAA